MFTGIVEDVGMVVSIDDMLCVKSSLDDVKGSSIAVNGVCLTLLKKDEGALVFELSEETLSRTNLSVSRYVNLERSLTFGSKVSGHIVLGHVDCVSDIISMDNKSMEVELPAKYARYAIEKGSVAIDGISLTIADVREHSFTVALLPYTIKSTNLRYGQKRVNLEFDYLVKAIQARVEKEDREEWKEIIGVM